MEQFDPFSRFWQRPERAAVLRRRGMEVVIGVAIVGREPGDHGAAAAGDGAAKRLDILVLDVGETPAHDKGMRQVLLGRSQVWLKVLIP